MVQKLLNRPIRLLNSSNLVYDITTYVMAGKDMAGKDQS